MPELTSHGGTMAASLRHQWRDTICGGGAYGCILEGPETVEVTTKNKVVIAKKKLKEARSRQKSYADRHQRALKFKTEDSVFLKVSPCKGVRHCDLKGKLSPRFICPFKILDRVGEVSYRLALSPQLSHVHNVFHISPLRGYNYHPLHVISYPLGYTVWVSLAGDGSSLGLGLNLGARVRTCVRSCFRVPSVVLSGALYLFTALTGTESTSAVVDVPAETTTALSVTFSSASVVRPISTDDYEVVQVDGHGGGGTEDQIGGNNVDPFPSVDDVEMIPSSCLPVLYLPFSCSRFDASLLACTITANSASVTSYGPLPTCGPSSFRYLLLGLLSLFRSSKLICNASSFLAMSNSAVLNVGIPIFVGDDQPQLPLNLSFRGKGLGYVDTICKWPPESDGFNFSCWISWDRALAMTDRVPACMSTCAPHVFPSKTHSIPLMMAKRCDLRFIALAFFLSAGKVSSVRYS
ncbi:hypothetical protein Tco_0427415 [Tanacetum coccineum]